MTPSPDEPRPRVAVIGGGISGLAAAHRLQELAPRIDCMLLESADRLGGVLRTEPCDDFLIETSADNFITQPAWAVELAERIGLADELLSTNPARRGASIVFENRLESVPEGFALLSPARILPVLRTPLLSPVGKLRLMLEPLIPARRSENEESLADFARRRLGREPYERIVQPLVSGIYTADPERLSMQAALPRFVEMEHSAGSLWRGARREARRRASAAATGARYDLFAAPRLGMTQLVERLASRLSGLTVRCGTTVQSIRRHVDGGWRIEFTPTTTEQSPIDVDAVIVSVPAPAAARILREVDTELTEQLASIEYAGCAIVVSAYRRDQFDQPLRGFGFVVPEISRRPILACSFASEKYPNRAPEDHVLLRTFLGGACHPELADLDDDALCDTARTQLAELLHVSGPPRLERVFRWYGKMPQYHLGHTGRVAAMDERLAGLPGLQLAGNAYRGVGVPQCIHSGETAAARVIDYLNQRTTATDPQSSARADA